MPFCAAVDMSPRRTSRVSGWTSYATASPSPTRPKRRRRRVKQLSPKSSTSCRCREQLAISVLRARWPRRATSLPQPVREDQKNSFLPQSHAQLGEYMLCRFAAPCLCKRMIPREILKKIRQIELRTTRLVSETLGGQYHSVFKGQGMNFEEVREYQPGDEVRAIDWNVTARMNHPFVKKFVEERELTLMLMVDLSGSGLFGSGEQSKRELAAEIASVLAFSAIRNNDKVGLILFTEEVEKFIPPRKGRRHVLRVIREILFFEPKKR